MGGHVSEKRIVIKSHIFGGCFIFDLNFAEAHICRKSCDHHIYMFARTNYTSYLSLHMDPHGVPCDLDFAVLCIL